MTSRAPWAQYQKAYAHKYGPKKRRRASIGLYPDNLLECLQANETARQKALESDSTTATDSEGTK